MKKTLLFALALIASGCAETGPRNLDDLVQQGDTYLDRDTMIPHSGPVFSFFSNDSRQVGLSANLKDGKMDGPYESYYENGQLQSKGTYVAGTQDGPIETYYENGQLQGKGTYAAGEWHGPYESYHENGQLEQQSTYAAGELDGLFEFYYDNGQLMRKNTYTDGAWHGPYEFYDENGQLQTMGTYDMGAQCGEWILGGETVTHRPCPPGLEEGN